MMKKILCSTSVIIGLLLFTACSNDSDDVVPPQNNDVTYTNTVRSIMNGNCTSCHSNPPTNGAPMPLTTFENVKNAVQTRGLITQIENLEMPPGGSLSGAQIQAIKDWQTGGFKE